MKSAKQNIVNTESILGEMPIWISRFGILFLLVILFLLIYLCSLVEYPVSIKSFVTITNNDSSITIFSKATGRINYYNVSDGQIVRKNETVAIIGGTANPDQVMQLRKNLLDYRSPNFLRKKLGLYDDLGELQHLYNATLEALDNLTNFTSTKYYPHKILNLENKLDILDKIYQNQLFQYELLCKKVELRNKNFIADSILKNSFSALSSDYNPALQSSVDYKYQLSLVKSDLLSTELEIQNLKTSLQGFRDEESLLRKEYIQELGRKSNALRAGIYKWYKMHVLESPIEGQVEISDNWRKRQNVAIGDSLIKIAPVNNKALVGKMTLTKERSRPKIEGKDIHISFARYPQQKYGTVLGTITKVSNSHDKNYYLAEVSFPDELRSTRGFEIQYYKEMVGEATITTDELSLLERTFRKFSSLLTTEK